MSVYFHKSYMLPSSSLWLFTGDETHAWVNLRLDTDVNNGPLEKDITTRRQLGNAKKHRVFRKQLCFVMFFAKGSWLNLFSNLFARAWKRDKTLGLANDQNGLLYVAELETACVSMVCPLARINSALSITKELQKI